MIKKTKTIRIPVDLANEASIVAKILNRSVNGQVAHWLKLGMQAEANPQLSLVDICTKEIKEAMENKND